MKLAKESNLEKEETHSIVDELRKRGMLTKRQLR
jgi:predicted transcriptional regulator